MTSLQKIRSESQAREYEERRKQEKKRNILVLTMRYLTDNGYSAAADRLSQEANVSLSRVDAADNVDLTTIVQEYEEFFEVKYGRRPKLTRKMAADEVPAGGGATRPGAPPMSAAMAAALPGRAAKEAGRLPRIPPGGGGSGSSRGESARGPGRGGGGSGTGQGDTSKYDDAAAAAGLGPSMALNSVRRRVGSGGPIVGGHPGPDPGPDRPGGGGGGGKRAGSKGSSAGGDGADGKGGDDDGGLGLDGGIAGLGVLGTKGHRGSSLPGGGGHAAARDEDDNAEDDVDDFFEMRVLKPLPDLGGGEMRDLGMAITRDIYLRNPNTRWEDIAGLDEAKKLLKEAVVMPIKYPQLFQGLLAPWKGVLLYGPPGTGKTMLARAVATECRTTFFNISASSIISKWRGDSEKLVRVLFELARYHAPSTIFLDELDALMSQRDGGGGTEHEASRRMKTELLIQMDGLARGDELVFLLAATNLPWELDMAMLRRLEKRILVPLPSEEARKRMFSKLLGTLPNGAADAVDFGMCASRTEGYSGSDVTVVCKECAMRPLRRVMAALEDGGLETGGGEGGSGGGADADAFIGPDGEVRLPPVTPEDVDKALTTTKPSARLYAARYNQFHEEYGQIL